MPLQLINHMVVFFLVFMVLSIRNLIEYIGFEMFSCNSTSLAYHNIFANLAYLNRKFLKVY